MSQWAGFPFLSLLFNTIIQHNKSEGCSDYGYRQVSCSCWSCTSWLQEVLSFGKSLPEVPSFMDLLHPLLGRVLLIGQAGPTQDSLLSLYHQEICKSFLVSWEVEHDYMSFYTGDSCCQLWTSCPLCLHLQLQKNVLAFCGFVKCSLGIVIQGPILSSKPPRPPSTMQRKCVFFVNQEWGWIMECVLSQLSQGEIMRMAPSDTSLQRRGNLRALSQAGFRLSRAVLFALSLTIFLLSPVSVSH